jgi:AraC-like DNA-binding protein
VVNQYFLFFFAMLGAFNGLGLALYLWFRPGTTPTQRWLALLVTAISVRTGKSAVYFVWPEIPKIYLQIGLTGCFFIGPCLFFLIRSYQSESLKLGRLDRWHVAALVLLTTVVGIAFPYATNIQLWRSLVTPSIMYSWLAYLVLATLLLYVDRARLQESSAKPLLLASTAGVWTIWFAYRTSGYTSYIVGALCFSFIICLSVAIYLRMRAGQAPIEPYQGRRIPQDEAATELQTLAELMARERLHLDPALTLPRLARRLGMPQVRLSQLLNDNNQTSLKQYLAQLRVGEAKLLLRQEPAKPLEAVAEAAGFQSMSTFYSTFKKLEGITPAAFRQREMTPEICSRSPGSDSKPLIS